MAEQNLTQILLAQWRRIRALSYDYLDGLDSHHLELRLPFPESQSLLYQFWCMTGAHESYLRKLEHGEWKGFSSSLDQLPEVTPQTIKAQMKQADDKMERLLVESGAERMIANGETTYEVVLQMIKHEIHHHGQMINLMFCHHLPIPESWKDEWALSYD
jgi:hypothetical protein